MAFKDKNIAVIVPAYNEEKLIKKTLLNIPDYIDKIFVVDDCSSDSTNSIIKKFIETVSRDIELITNEVNRGVGYSIKKGYTKSISSKADIAVVMAGDNQMDPKYLPSLLDPLIEDGINYSKGNRLRHKDRKKMPLFRRFGNNLLTFINKISTGFWNISDPQNGYTAIKVDSINKLDLSNVYDRYGYCNDILIEANVHNLNVVDVNMPPVYQDERSDIRIGNYIVSLSYLLTKGFFRRIHIKYGGNNFNPILVIFYLSLIFGFLTFVQFGKAILFFISEGNFPLLTTILSLFTFTMASIFALFFLFFDYRESTN